MVPGSVARLWGKDRPRCPCWAPKEAGGALIAARPCVCSTCARSEGSGRRRGWCALRGLAWRHRQNAVAGLYAEAFSLFTT